MNKLYRFLSIIFFLTSFTEISQATMPTYDMTIRNLTLFPNSVTGADSIIQFDIFILWTNSADPTCDRFEFGASQLNITFNPAMSSTGTLTASKVAISGGINFPSSIQNPTVQIVGNLFQASSNNPFGLTNFIIGDTFPGNRMIRVKIRTSSHRLPCVTPNLRFQLQPPNNTFCAYFMPPLDSLDPDNQLLGAIMDTNVNHYITESNNAICENTVLLNLTSFIQGFYNNVTDLMKKDTVRIYLRGSSPPYQLVDSSKGVLDSAGKGTFTFLYANTFTNSYIIIKHRNSIETWSAAGQSFTTLNYDFTTSPSQAFGGNLKQVDTSPLKFACYNGDVNQDGVVNLTDRILIHLDVFNFVTGYSVTDLNGDNITNLFDVIIAVNNIVNFVTKVTP